MRLSTLGFVVLVCGCPGGDDPGTLPDAPSVDAPIEPTCAAPTGAGTVHMGTISAPESWTAEASPHVLPAGITITSAVTLEPCAVVRVADDRTIDVRAGGSLVATGTATQPVIIERSDPNASWAQIRAVGGGTLSFTHTTIRGGGDPQNAIPTLAGAIDISGTAPPTSPILHVDHVRIEGSECNGVNLHDGGGFTATSTDLTITGSSVAPIVTFSRHAGTIPTGTYTGNTLDAIVLRGTGGPEVVAETMTLRNRGVKYRVGVQNNPVLDVVNLAATPPTLTIEAGVKIEFMPGGTLRVDPSFGTTLAAGALIAVGTLANPIVFTSAAATPAAGDWYGIWFGRQPRAESRIDHARVEYAGKDSGSGSDSCIPDGQVDATNDAGIRILGGIPLSVFITNTTIMASAKHGIDLGFRSDAKPDFKTPNTFVDVPNCQTTRPRDGNGACPTPSTCL